MSVLSRLRGLLAERVPLMDESGQESGAGPDSPDSDFQLDEQGRPVRRPTRLGRSLHGILEGAIAAGATPNIAGGGPTDIFRAMQAAGEVPERHQLIAQRIGDIQAQQELRRAQAEDYRTGRMSRAVMTQQYRNALIQERHQAEQNKDARALAENDRKWVEMGMEPPARTVQEPSTPPSIMPGSPDNAGVAPTSLLSGSPVAPPSRPFVTPFRVPPRLGAGQMPPKIQQAGQALAIKAGAAGLQAPVAGEEYTPTPAAEEALPVKTQADIALTKAKTKKLGEPKPPVWKYFRGDNGHITQVGTDPDTGKEIARADLGKIAATKTEGLMAPVAGMPPAPPTGDAKVDAVLAKYPEQVRPVAQGFLSYRTIMPTGRNAQSPLIQGALQAAREADPTFDPKNYPMQQRVMNSMTSGKDHTEIEAINVTLGHVGRLHEAISALKNGDLQILNRIANFVGVQTGQDPVIVFRTIVNRVGPEITRAYVGTGGEAVEREANKLDFNPANSPQQLEAATKETANLLGSKIDAKMQTWKGAMGDRPFPLAGGTVVMPAAREALEKIRAGGGRVNENTPAGARPIPGQPAERNKLQRKRPLAGGEYEYQHSLDGGRTWQAGKLPSQ